MTRTPRHAAANEPILAPADGESASPPEGGETPRLNGLRSRLATLLFPSMQVRTTVLEAVAVLAFASVVAFFHLGSAALAGRPWAEDGALFMQQALDSGPLSPIGRGYAGYLNVGPRLAAGAVSLLPLGWQGVAIHAAAALITGAVAMVAYLALRGQLPGRAPRIVLVACVAAVPVGTETIGSIANMQWFLLYGALISLFWGATSARGSALIAVVGFVATTSSPFAVLIVAASVVRWLLIRGRGALAVAAANLLGFALQTMTMVTAPPRGPQLGLDPGLHLRAQIRGYLSRVLGDGLFGIGRFSGAPEPSIRTGLLVVSAVVVVTLLTLGRTRYPATLLFVTLLLALSLATYFAPVVVSGTPTTNPYFAGRYFVAPVLFALTMIIVLLARVGSGWRTAGASLARRFNLAIASVVAAGTLVALAYGIVTSFDLSSVYDRDRGPSWSSAVDAQRRACSGRPDTYRVAIQTPPGPGWQVLVTCGRLR